MQVRRIMIAAFIVLSVLAVLDFVRPGAGMLGGVFDQSFVKLDPSSGRTLPPAFEESRTLEPAAVSQGEAVTVAGTAGDLRVREAATDEATVAYTVQVWGSGDAEGFARGVSAAWRRDEGGVRLVVESPTEMPHGIRSFQVDIDLTVPQGTDVAIGHRGNVTVEGLGGELQLDLFGSRAEIRSVQGPVLATSQFGSLSVVGAGGPVSINHSGGEVVVRDVEGSVSGEMQFGRVTIASVSGDVTFGVSQGGGRFEEIGGDLDLSAGFGSFDVADVRGFVDLDVRMGEASVDRLRGGADLRVEFGELSVRLVPGGGWSVDGVVEMGEFETDFDLKTAGSGPRTVVSGVIGDGSNRLAVDVRQGAAKLLRTE